MAEKKVYRLAMVKNCMDCPFVAKKLTKGYGYATDYLCTKAGNAVIRRYVEWPSEEPKDHEFPQWCPLEERKA